MAVDNSELTIDIIKSIMEWVVTINHSTAARAFLEYSGHIAQLSVRVYKDGNWRGKPIIKEEIRFDESASKRRFRHLRDDLQAFWVELMYKEDRK